MRTLTARHSRALAIALLVVVALAIFLGLVRPYVAAYGSYHEEIATLNDRLARYRAVASQRDVVVDRAVQLRDDPSLAVNFLAQETPALAAAALQQYVKRAIGQSGGGLVSTQAVPSKETTGIVEATVKVRMRGNSDTIQKLFHRLEAGHPLVFIDNVSLRATGRQGLAKGQHLDMRFDLTGYLRPPAT